MVKNRIYISGPISHYDLEERRSTFKQAQLMLEAQGFEVFNPMENGIPPAAPTCRHMRRDLNVLTDEQQPFSAIYMLHRWTHSAGCQLEFRVATAIGLDIYFQENGSMIKFD